MVAITDCRFTIAPDRRAFLNKPTLGTVKFSVYMILHQLFGLAVLAFHYHH